MTTENQPQLPPPPAATQPQPSGTRLWPLWLLSLLIILGVAGLAWYGWQQLQQHQLRVAELGTLQSAVQQQQQRLGQLEQGYQERVNRLDSRQDQVADQIQRLDRQLSHTSQQILNMGAKGRTDWLLAEAEYLLRLANQRLLMERDAEGALAILQAADGVLAETDEIALYPVRKQVAEEILALQGVAELDRTGVFLKLEALSKAIDKLEQRLDEPEQALLEEDSETSEPQPGAGIRERAAGLWEEVKQLVVIRRLDEPAQPLLPPENIFFLRQNLRLMIEQAELALLEKNQALYDASLSKAHDWVNRYFTSPTQGANTVARAFMNHLESLQQVNVDPELPDISESLRSLKSLVASMYENRQAPRQENRQQQQNQPPQNEPQPEGAAGSGSAS